MNNKNLIKRAVTRIHNIAVSSILRRKTREYRSTMKMIKDTEYMTKEEIEKYHLKRLKNIVRYCRLNIPYYTNLFNSLHFTEDKLNSLNDFRVIPVLTKADLKENLASLSLPPSKLQKALYGTTGGTTGVPVGFYSFRKTMQSKEHAYVDDIWSRLNYKPGRKLAILRGARFQKPAKDGFYWRKNSGSPNIFLSSYHLDEESSLHYSNLIIRKKCQYLHAYPSSVFMFYKLLDKIDAEKPPIKGIFTSSEVLSPENREYIEFSSGTKILDLYGSSERVTIAGECVICGQLHVYPQYGYTELIDSSGESVTKEGAVGSVIGTSYSRRATPLLRYEVGDLAVLSKPKKLCGRSYMSFEAIHGRKIEFVISTTNRKVSMVSLSIHYGIFDPLIKFQFYQDKKGQVEFHYIPNEVLQEHELIRIRDFVSSKLGEGFVLKLTEKGEIKTAENGKHRMLIQKLEFNW